MKKIILSLIVLILFISSCKEKRAFVPEPKYDTGTIVYMKPDSIEAYVKFFSVMVGKDTTYYYGITYADKQGKYHTRIIRDVEIFGIKKGS